MTATAASGLCEGWKSSLFDPCLLPNAAVSAVHTTVSVAHGAAAAGSFMAHPFEHMNRTLQKAASGLVTDVLPGLEKVTRPDLSRAWFAHAYAGAFAIALLAFVVLVGWNFVQRARGRIGGEELVESLFLYGPLFLAGAVFGPAAGAFLLRFTGALTDSVTSFFGTSGSPTGSTSRLQEIIAAATPTGITGGAVVGVLFLLALVLALVMVFMVLLVMSVTLYLTGVIAPLSLVWLVHPHRRGRGLKVVNVWVGICFSHVLLFFLLGAVFSMFTDLPFTHTFAPGGGAHTANAAASSATPGGSPFAELVALAVAVIALFTAVLSPLGFLRFAPVAPTAAPATSRAGAGGGAGRLPGARRGAAGRGSGGFADAAAGPVDGPGGGRRGGSGAGPVGGGLAPSYAAYRRGPSSTGAGTSGGTAAGGSSGGAAAGAAGRAGAAGVAGGLAAAAGPVRAAVAVATKGARKARAAGEAAAAHMGHAEGGHGVGEGLAPRHHR